VSPEDLPAYAVVTPVRDEIEHFARTAESLLAQSHRPVRWVIVDDGSTDGTRELAAEYAAEHDWIAVTAAPERHERARGAPIVRAFEHGRATIAEPHHFVVKLDGDLFLPANYFAWVARVFADDPRTGIAGGIALIPGDDGRWRPDAGLQLATNGVAKAYNAAFLEELGGLPATMGWDGIDEYAARSRGWHVHVLTELAILHYRPRGSKQAWWRARWEEGRGNHFMGYRWDFLALRAAYRMLVERPPVLGGLVLGAGFAWSALRRAPRSPDAGARELLRADQRARMARLLRRGSGPRLDALPGGGPAYSATSRSTTDT
jgi:biofilm PGA synthesis N-glycosyltransferase PgaC